MNRNKPIVSQAVTQFQPRRISSWWSVAEDLLWPERKVKGKIRRRADASAVAVLMVLSISIFYSTWEKMIREYVLRGVKGILSDRPDITLEEARKLKC